MRSGHRKTHINTQEAGQVLSLALALLCVGLLYLYFSSRPPRESKLVGNFIPAAPHTSVCETCFWPTEVRAVYARRVVETAESGLPHAPGGMNFPLRRFNDYRMWLEQAHSEEVFRVEGSNRGICIAAWAAGFGGDTRHIDTCWMEQIPLNQAAGLDDFYKTPKPRHPVFRHIDSNWYLWADW